MNSKDQLQPIFFPLYRGCVDILYEIFHTGRRTDRTLDYFYKNNKKWGARDRRWVAEQVYGCIRQWRYVLKCSGVQWSDDFLPHNLKTSRPLNMKQIESAFQVYLQFQNFSMDEIKGFVYKPKSRALHSEDLCTDYFHRLGKEQLKDWGDILKAQIHSASPFIRVNLLKAPSRDECLSRMQQENIPIEKVHDCESALKLMVRKNIFQTKTFEDGWVEMQDVASQKVAPMLDPQPGERVIDACAGAGGKTLHIAEKMKNKGQIIALDIHEWKLKELKNRAKRAGVHNVETRVVDSQKVIKRLKKSADRLLLDVPCSGSGVLRRNPDPKWRLTESDWRETLDLQQQLLQNYSSMLKAGGTMVYSTCSVLPDENHNQIQNFLKSEFGERFELVEEFFNWPHKSDYDGFYAARLKTN